MMIMSYKFLLIILLHINFCIKPIFNVYYDLVKNIYFKYDCFNLKNINEKKNDKKSIYAKKNFFLNLK